MTNAQRRSRRYRENNIAKGLCEYCPRRLTLYKTVCNVHRLYKRRWQNKKLGYKAMGQGGVHGTMPYGEKLLATPDSR